MHQWANCTSQEDCEGSLCKYSPVYGDFGCSSWLLLFVSSPTKTPISLILAGFLLRNVTLCTIVGFTRIGFLDWCPPSVLWCPSYFAFFWLFIDFHHYRGWIGVDIVKQNHRLLTLQLLGVHILLLPWVSRAPNVHTEVSIGAPCQMEAKRGSPLYPSLASGIFMTYPLYGCHYSLSVTDLFTGA